MKSKKECRQEMRLNFKTYHSKSETESISYPQKAFYGLERKRKIMQKRVIFVLRSLYQRYVVSKETQIDERKAVKGKILMKIWPPAVCKHVTFTHV